MRRDAIFRPPFPDPVARAGGEDLSVPPSVGAARPFKLPHHEERTLTNGLRVILIEHHAQPVVSLHMLVRTGAAAEPVERAGLAQLTASLLTSGTEAMSATELAETIDSAGGSLDASAEWDSSSASTTVLVNRVDTAAGLLADVLMRPAFDQEEIDRVRSRMINGLQVSLSNPGYVADLVLNKVVYGALPYSHPIAGTPDTLQTLTREEIVAFHRAHYVGNNSMLAIVGDLEPEAAFALAEAHFGGWVAGEATPVPRHENTAPGPVRIIALDKPDATQTEVRIGIASINRNHPDYFPAIVANTIFGGGAFSSRIGKELRVKRGLTYGAYSRFDTRLRGGAFVLSTNTKTETTAEALHVIVEEMERMRGEDVPADELKTRKDYLVGSFSIALETPDAVASRLLNAELYGLGKHYLESYTSKVGEITAGDVRRVVNERVRPDQLVVVLAGNAAGFEEDVRALHLGPVEVIPFDVVDPLAETLRR
jgi:zinc protease